MTGFRSSGTTPSWLKAKVLRSSETGGHWELLMSEFQPRPSVGKVSRGGVVMRPVVTEKA